MRVLNKEIDVICIFQQGKIPEPRKFKIKYNDGTYKIVDVDSIRRIEDNTPLGLHNYVYHCTSEVGELLINYEIKYIIQNSTWMLYRIV